MSFQELFDYLWDHGIGNGANSDGDPVPWTAESLEIALDGKLNARSIVDWKSGKRLPQVPNLHALARIIADGDEHMRKRWAERLIEERQIVWDQRNNKKEKATETEVPVEPEVGVVATEAQKRSFARKWVGLGAGAAALVGIIVFHNLNSVPSVKNMRICDAPYFDEKTKRCSQHVSVFVHGIDEVFLSFDFKNVPHGMPFERWWILNGERVAGRTSFNDEAWDGWTFWRPAGGLQIGQYVVRLVVDGRVETQTFYVQADGFYDKDEGNSN